MWSRVGLVAVVIAVGTTAGACADDGPFGVPPDSPALLGAAVAVRATACRPVDERGAGLLVAPDQVLTAAHVVAGATSVRVVGSTGVEATAEVVAFDPDNDLAVLAISAPLGRHVPMATVPPRGTFVGEVVVFRQDRAVVERVESLRRVLINTDDIYRGAVTARPGYELRAAILPGDSGAVVVHEGEAVAVVWSRSRITDGRAWAIDAIRGGGTIFEQLSSGRLPDSIDLGRCA